MKQFKCIQSLYKSTYEENAFNEGKIYNFLEEDNEFIWISSEANLPVSFSKEKGNMYYFIGDYFIEL